MARGGWSGPFLANRPVVGTLVAEASSKVFDLLLLAHVLAALTSLGVVAAAAYNSAEAVRLAGLLEDRELPRALKARVDRLRRFYRPGHNVLGRVIFLVPAFGLALVAEGGGPGLFRLAWLQGGIVAWVVAAAVAEGVLWPADRRLRALISEAASRQGRSVARLDERLAVAAAAHQAQLAASVVVICIVTAFVLMIGQPH